MPADMSAPTSDKAFAGLAILLGVTSIALVAMYSDGIGIRSACLLAIAIATVGLGAGAALGNKAANYLLALVFLLQSFEYISQDFVSVW